MSNENPYLVPEITRNQATYIIACHKCGHFMRYPGEEAHVDWYESDGKGNHVYHKGVNRHGRICLWVCSKCGTKEEWK